MIICLALIAAGILLRQADRWWHTPRRSHRPLTTLYEVRAFQRDRANNHTPALLLLGHWIELAGWALITARTGPLGWAAVVVAGAVKMRHLQEVSHFAVHGVLTRTARRGAVLAEAAVHVPLGFVPITVRRQRHVREHHPNATVTGADPNLQELHDAGLHPGISRAQFARALVFPLTPTGTAATVRGIHANLRTSTTRWWRLAGFIAVPAALLLATGWQGALFAFVLPRLLLYPQLSWMSLLVEHRWWDAEAVTGPPAVVEAARCLRLYPHNPLLALIARGSWLPYGDLFHYAHSAHPAVRWNYLPTLERHTVGIPQATVDAFLLGKTAVVRRHLQALTAPARPAASQSPEQFRAEQPA
ncbi:fatty acid desaturase [Streptomyces vinaceus]|uniref:fatty acid desaturase n=1 Tax=Streptomyces vinaceus TaxID=1960 RepID=UPI003821EB24